MKRKAFVSILLAAGILTGCGARAVAPDNKEVLRTSMESVSAEAVELMDTMDVPQEPEQQYQRIELTTDATQETIKESASKSLREKIREELAKPCDEIDLQWLLSVADKVGGTKDFTEDELIHRNGKLYIWKIIGQCINENGDGYDIALGEGTPMSYITYRGSDDVEVGDIVCSYLIFNPDNNYVDGHDWRFDFIIDRRELPKESETEILPEDYDNVIEAVESNMHEGMNMEEAETAPEVVEVIAEETRDDLVSVEDVEEILEESEN